MSGFLGAGDLYADLLDANGAATGLQQIGNCVSFEITEAADLAERTSRMKSTYGQVLDSVALKTPAQISITLDDLMMVNFTMALLGTLSSTTVAGSTTSVSIEPASAGYWHDLGLRNISAMSAKNSAGSAFVSGTDFWWDGQSGLVKFTDDGGIYHQDEPINVKYTQTGYTYNQILGGTDADLKATLFLNGKNKTDNKQVMVTVYEALFRPESGIQFISTGEFTQLQLTGTLNTPSGYTHAYKIEEFTAGVS